MGLPFDVHTTRAEKEAVLFGFEQASCIYLYVYLFGDGVVRI